MAPDLQKRVSTSWQHFLSLSANKRTAYLQQLHLDDPEVAIELETLLKNNANGRPRGGDTVDYPGPATESADHGDKHVAVRNSSADGQETATYLPGGPIADHVSTIRPVSATEPALSPHAKNLPVIPGYEVEQELGRGGMGVVYKATDVALKREVAIKMIRGGDELSEHQKNRFRTEAEAVARLRHPHIVQILYYGESDDGPYFVMEYVAGTDLKKHLQNQPQPSRDAARFVMLLARAMHAAHQKQIVHRDLKPSNILLDPAEEESALNTAFGCPKITDFGLAKKLDHEEGHTQSGAVVGSAGFMSPEQASGASKEVGPATDIYALGAILYDMLTGRPPFQGDNFSGTLIQIMTQQPVPPRQLSPDVPDELAQICLTCLQKEPSKRYASAAALAEELQRYLEDQPLRITPPVQVDQGRRGWLPIAGVAVAVTLLAALLLWRPWQPGSGTANLNSPFKNGKPGMQKEAAVYKGFIDLQVTEKKNPARQLLWLYDPAARPLRKDDEVSLHVELNKEAYLYVLWIDTKGEVLPVYPWRDGDWQKRPVMETRHQKLRVPPNAPAVWEIDPGPAGMEMLVLLARPTPLPEDIDLAARLGKWEPLPLTDELEVSWFVNGKIKRDDVNRAANLKKTTATSNPLVRLQAELWNRLKDDFPHMTAVTFANRGG